MREIQLDEAKSILSSLITAAEKGETVFISDNGHKVMLVPVTAHDPVFDRGEDPLDDDITDASVNHDYYIYNGK